jgi:hypothetical protein
MKLEAAFPLSAQHTQTHKTINPIMLYSFVNITDKALNLWSQRDDAQEK